MGLSVAEAEAIEFAAAHHDLGKFVLPSSILEKPGRLIDSERRQLQQHVVIGASWLAQWKSDAFQLACQVALTHHERWDGLGYPAGLRGSAIPLGARIVAVVDVFDALTQARSYKFAWRRSTAMAEISRESGRQFDPSVASAFLATVARCSGGDSSEPEAQ